MSSYTLSQTNGRFNSLKFDTLFQNPYQYKIPGLSKDTKNRLYEAYISSRRPAMEPPVPETRSLLDRTLDGLQVFNYTDRKSTRLNSSHVRISYAVFCLKKKKKNNKFYLIQNNKLHHNIRYHRTYHSKSPITSKH